MKRREPRPKSTLRKKVQGTTQNCASTFKVKNFSFPYLCNLVTEKVYIIYIYEDITEGTMTVLSSHKKDQIGKRNYRESKWF